jgi:hypothetical protein
MKTGPKLKLSARNMTTTGRHWYQNVNDILRFPLDTVLTEVDTALR